MENFKLELAEASLTDIKELVKKYPNDSDLGKHIRSYFRNLPDVIKEFKEEINKK